MLAETQKPAILAKQYRQILMLVEQLPVPKPNVSACREV